MELFHSINNFIIWYFPFCLSFVSPHENTSFISVEILFEKAFLILVFQEVGRFLCERKAFSVLISRGACEIILYPVFSVGTQALGKVALHRIRKCLFSQHKYYRPSMIPANLFPCSLSCSPWKLLVLFYSFTLLKPPIFSYVFSHSQ